MTLTFRNLKQSPDDPVAAWPTEAVQAALERGSLAHWHRLAIVVRSDPWGPTARRLEEVLRHSRPYGVAEVMTRMLERARAEWERRERGEVAAEIASLLAASGLSGEGFARRIGTSGSRLSTYLSGKVVPSATLLVRMRHVAGACPPLKAAAGYPAPSVPDPERAARQLAAVLGLVDSLPFRVKRRPLTYPVLARL